MKGEKPAEQGLRENPLATVNEENTDSGQVPVQVTETEISNAQKNIPLVLLLILFIGSVGAGFWAGGRLMSSDSQWRVPGNQPASASHGSSRVFRGLFLPLEDGDKTLFLSLSIQIGEHYPYGGHPIQAQSLCGTVFEAVQTMEVNELMGEKGMKSLKLTIKNMLHRRYPNIVVKDIHFLDYTII